MRTTNNSITQLFEFLAEHDGCPILLAADLNRSAGDPFLEQHLVDGRWTDLIQVTTGHRAPTTVDMRQREGGHPIDHLIGNAAVARQVLQVQMDQEPLASHFPIQMTVRWEGGHKTLTLQDRCRLPPEAHQPTPDEHKQGWQWEHRRQQLQRALQQDDSNQATIEWMRRWEELLVTRARHHGARLLPAMLGRWRLDPPCEKQRGRHRPQQEVEDRPLVELKRIRNLLIEFQVRQARQRPLDQRQARQVRDLLQRHGEELRRQRGQRPHHQRPPPLPDPPPALPEADQFMYLHNHYEEMGPEEWEVHQTLLRQVRAAITCREQRLRRDRIHKWQEQLRATTRLGTAKCHAYVKGRVINPLQRLRDQDGTIVTLPEDLHRVLRAAWSPIDQPHDPHDERCLSTDHAGELPTTTAMNHGHYQLSLHRMSRQHWERHV